MNGGKNKMQGKIVKRKVYVVIPVDLEIYCGKTENSEEKFKSLIKDAEKDFDKIAFWSTSGLGVVEQLKGSKIVSENPLDK